MLRADAGRFIFGFQNKALRLFASLAIDGILRVKINLRRMSERLCRSREWRPCTTTSTLFSPRSKNSWSASNLSVRGIAPFAVEIMPLSETMA
jgi:hypothetical protein